MNHDNEHDNNNETTYYLGRAPIWRAIAHLCIPMMAALSVGVIYNLINAGFVGSLHDTQMLAALTFGLPVLTLVMAIGGMFGAGGSAAIARLLGQSDIGKSDTGQSDTQQSEPDPEARTNARRTGGFVIYGSILGATIVASVALLLVGPLVNALGTDADSVAATTRYVVGMLAFTPIMVAAFAVDQLVRAEGAARVSMIGTIVGTVANLLLDALFILVLHLDVLGAALGMGLANLVSLGYLLWWVRRHSTVLSISPRWFSVRRSVVRPVLSVGASELLMSSFMLVSTLTMSHIAVRYGDSAIAAFGVAQRVVQLPEMLAMGIFIGVLPMIAYSYGSGNSARLVEALKRSAIAIGGLIAVFSTGVLLFRSQLFNLFGAEPEVVQIGIKVTIAMLVSTVFNGFVGLIMTWLQASDQGGRAAVLGIVQGGLFIPAAIGLTHLYGLGGLIWSITAAEGITLVVAVILAGRGRRITATRRWLSETTELVAFGSQRPAELA